MLHQTQLEVVPVEALELYDWDGQEPVLDGCYYPEGVRGNEDQIFFLTVLREDHQVLDVFVMLLDMDVLPLMDDELEIDFDIRQLLHPLERTFLAVV